jgi:NAD(P)-dependent dehydrogenase (short-subunit alcohol dehydrogenase family)
MAGYSASKAAAHSITQALRAELRPRGISVLGAYPGGIDTDMLAGVQAPKAPPQLVASRIVSALAAGESLTFPDDASAAAGNLYLTDPVKLEQTSPAAPRAGAPGRRAARRSRSWLSGGRR